jgi:hypothetical protein
MSSMKTRVFTTAVVILSLGLVAFAQQTTPPTQQPSASQRQPEYVEEKGFKGRVFEIKHRDPGSLQAAVRPLGSGFRGATISVNSEFKTLTVRDFPENIAAIEEALKRLDTPEPPRPSIQLRIYVLIASNAALPAPTAELPAELNDVIRGLQSALKYRNYSLMTSEIMSTREGPGGIRNQGVAESKLFNVATPNSNPIFYSYEIHPINVDQDSSGSTTVQIGSFSFNMRIPLNLSTNIVYENVGFRSPVSVRQGEKVVVGTTTMGDKGLIVVLSTNATR